MYMSSHLLTSMLSCEIIFMLYSYQLSSSPGIGINVEEEGDPREFFVKLIQELVPAWSDFFAIHMCYQCKSTELFY